MRNSTLNKTFRLIKPLLILVVYPLSSTADNMLPKVVITATRTAQTVDDSLASVTVISRDDIENSQAFTVPDILRGVPGLDISSNGGLGKTSSVFMRGTQSGHVLVLIDGIKIGSATLGTVPFQHLPLSQIERIEIVRGPRSSLYGSEAIGGVIQIFTRQWKGKKPRITVSGGMGADNTYEFDASVSGATENNWYSLGANRMQTDGFNACQGNNSGGCFTIEPDDDGYENNSFSAKIGHRFVGNSSISAHAIRTKGNTQFDSSFNNEADFTQQVIGIKADYVINEQWLLNLNVGESLDKFDESAESYFHTTRSTYALQNNFFLENQELILGYEQQIDDVASHIIYTINSITNKAMFAEYQTNFGATSLLVGLRRDDNEQFGEHTTKNISLSYALSHRTRFIASYGTAFKAPSFNELYFPNYGNSALIPEESESYEIGLLGQQQYYNWSINGYKTKIDKLIATSFDAINSSYYADNINKTKIIGMDAAINWHKNNWEFNTKISWLKPEDDATGNLLPRRAEKSLAMEIAEKRGPARLGIDVLVQSYRYDDAANTRRLGGYGIVNLTGAYNLNKNWTLQMRLENMLDKDYEMVYAYNTSGRFWVFGINYKS
jgi:vitamin B12 transporter